VTALAGRNNKNLNQPQQVMGKATKAIVLFGAPGSGKGTQAEQVCKQFNYVHVATGDLFRENLKNNTDLGKLAKGFMEKGALVPDDVTAAMLKDRLQRGDEATGYMLDGFPRTLPQAEMLAKILQELAITLVAVIYIKVSDQVIIDRLGGRLICRNCQAPYHLTGKPPKKAGVCDACGGELYQRADDNPQTVKARLDTFHNQTAPLIEFYRNGGLLVDIDGEVGLANVTKLIATAVSKL
jgi:adenylate kinase